MSNSFRLAAIGVLVMVLSTSRAATSTMNLTINGVTYQNVRIAKKGTDMVVLLHDAGTNAVPVSDLPDSLQLLMASDSPANQQTPSPVEKKIVALTLHTVTAIHQLPDGTYSASILTDSNTSAYVVFDSAGFPFMQRLAQKYQAYLDGKPTTMPWINSKVYGFPKKLDVVTAKGQPVDAYIYHLIGCTQYQEVNGQVRYAW